MQKENNSVINMLEYAKNLEQKNEREKIINEVVSEIKNGKLKVKKINLDIKQEEFLNKFKIYIPKNFKLMPDKIAKAKYPSEARPNIIYTDKNNTCNIGLNYLNVLLTDDMVIEFRDAMKDAYLLENKSAQIIEKSSFKVEDTTIAYYSFYSPAGDINMFNLISILSIEDKPLIINFNCLEKDKEKLELLFFGILKTIEII